MRDDLLTGLTRRRWLQLAGVSALVAACGGAPPGSVSTATATAAAATATALAMPKPEKTAIKIGLRLPNLNQQAPMRVAEDKGFFKEAGFSSVEIITTEQTREGVVGGSLDIAHLETTDLIEAAANRGVPVRLIAAHSNYTSMMIAVRPEIKTVKDLEGKDILLGGTPGTKDYDDRAAFLKKAGWDMSTIKANPVTVAGGSDVWVRLLGEGKLFMTPIFNRHKKNVVAAGHRLVVDERVFGSDVLTATTTMIQQSPNTLTAFIWAYIKALQVVKDPAQADYIFGLGPKIGINVTQAIKDAWDLDASNFKPHDAGYDVQEMRDLTQRVYGRVIDPKTFTDTTALHKAQQLHKLPTSPKL